MPYFDDLTYEITGLFRRDRSFGRLRSLAIRFYEKMITEETSYPEQVVNACLEAIRKNDYNEIVILADSMTPYRINVGEAFTAEYMEICGLYTEDRKKDLFRLICVGAASYYSYRRNEGTTLGNAQELIRAIERYNREYGKEDLAFLEPFQEYMAERNRQLDETYRRAREIQREREERERIQREQQEEEERKQREEQKRLEQERIQREQIELKQQRRIERETILADFQQLNTEEKLERILSDKNHGPNYYDMDYEALSDDELKELPTALLVRILTAYVHYRGKKWRAFRVRISKILSER